MSIRFLPVWICYFTTNSNSKLWSSRSFKLISKPMVYVVSALFEALVTAFFPLIINHFVESKKVSLTDYLEHGLLKNIANIVIWHEKLKTFNSSSLLFFLFNLCTPKSKLHFEMEGRNCCAPMWSVFYAM